MNFQYTIFLIQQALLEENLNTQINYNRWYGTDKRLREESFKLKSKLLLSFLEKLASKKWLISYLQTDFQLSFHRKKWRNLTQGEDQFTCGSFRSSCEWRIWQTPSKETCVRLSQCWVQKSLVFFTFIISDLRLTRPSFSPVLFETKRTWTWFSFFSHFT